MISKYLLFPYYLTLKIRNSLYDKGSIKSISHGIPVYCIGNVTVGGTGKTPMTELVIRELRKNYRVAVISCGYKRKGRGFKFVNSEDAARKVGDEALQIKRKFPDVTVAVDKNRNRAIGQLSALPEAVRPEVILLDDAFQYRKVAPAKNIMLVDYNRPIFRDELLPVGRLRDLPEQIRRAETVVITKCPEYLDEWEREKMRILTRTRHTQTLLFAKTKYCTPKAVFPECGDNRYIYSKEVHVFSGIADDTPIRLQLSASYDYISHKSFPDHHRFTRSDIRYLNNYAKKHPRTFLLTTEKDSQRLIHCKNISDEVKKRLYYLPIETEFLTFEEAEQFRNILKEGLPDKYVYTGLLF